jgi:tetratricopeptide (TPR) repeat protein
MSKAVEYRLGQANVLRARGELRRFRGDLEGAARDYNDALAMYQAVENRLGQANVLQARGDLERTRDHQAQALDWYKQALRLYQEVPNPHELGNTWAEVARARLHLGEVDAARRAAQEALRFAIPGENRYAEELARRVLEQINGAGKESERAQPSREAAEE